MWKFLPMEAKQLLAAVLYLAILLATVVSFLSNPAPSWADYMAALPGLLPFMALAFFNDDRMLMWALTDSVSSLERAFGPREGDS